MTSTKYITAAEAQARLFNTRMKRLEEEVSDLLDSFYMQLELAISNNSNTVCLQLQLSRVSLPYIRKFAEYLEKKGFDVPTTSDLVSALLFAEEEGKERVPFNFVVKF